MSNPDKRLAIENNPSKELIIYSKPSPANYTYLTSYVNGKNKEFNLYLQVKKYRGNNQKYHHITLRVNERDFWVGKLTPEGLILWNNTGSTISQIFYPSDNCPEMTLTEKIGDKVLRLSTMTRDRLPIKPPMSNKDRLKKLDKHNRLKRISR